MAITINSQPTDDIIPVYTYYVPYVVTSTLNTESDFRYVFDLYTKASWNVTPYIFQSRVSSFPRGDGKGVFSPHMFLQSLVGEVDIDPFEEGFFRAQNHYESFEIQLFEQYNPNIYYREVISISATESQIGFALGEDGNPTQSVFEVGDLIFIDPLNKEVEPRLFGESEIISVTYSSTYSYINVATGSATASPYNTKIGYITNLLRYDSTTDRKGAINMTEQYLEYGNSKVDDFIMKTSSNGFFLSEHREQVKYVYDSTYETISYLTDQEAYPNFSDFQFKVDLYDNSSSLIQTLTYSITTPIGAIPTLYSGVGYKNLEELATVLGTTLSTSAQTWEVNLLVSGATISNGMTYSLKTQCREYDLIHLGFKNKLGGVDFYTFNLVSRYNSSVQRTIINRNLDYDFSNGDRGRDVIDQTIKENWTINTDFITDYEALFIRELIESPQVYLIDNVNKKLIPIIITSNSYEFKSTLNDELIQYTINFEKSIDINSNI